MERVKRIVLFLLIFVFFAGMKLYAEEELGIGYRITDKLRQTGLSEELIVVIISALPIVELRGAIPVVHFLGMNIFMAYFLAVIGNMIPVIPILLLIGPISRWAMRYKYGNKFFSWLFKRTRRKSASIEKYETLGLTIFVAIPLPVTGAWTGCVAAFLMGTSLKHSFMAILLGVMIAGVIISTLCVLGWIGAIIAGAALITVAVLALLNIFKREDKGETGDLPAGIGAASAENIEAKDSI